MQTNNTTTYEISSIYLIDCEDIDSTQLQDLEEDIASDKAILAEESREEGLDDLLF